MQLFFQKLSDEQLIAGPSVKVITKPTLHKCLSYALKSSEHLDENEIAQISQFCFDAISCPPAGSRNIVKDILDLIPRSQPKQSVYGDYIYEGPYHECCLMNDVLGFDEVVRLFDKDRRRHLFEHFFMPQDFRRCLERARNVKPNTQEFSSIVGNRLRAKASSHWNIWRILRGGKRTP